MSGSILISSGGGLTRTENRPNIIISDIRKAPGDEKNDLARLLAREEINVCCTDSEEEILSGLCSGEDRHMVIIRDGGLAAPAFDIIESIRKFSDIPLMTVSDDCSEIYRIMALSKGADACMSAGDMHHFESFEFKARVVSMLRRYVGMNPGTPIKKPLLGDTLINGELTVDRRRREVYSGGVRIRMTSIEYGIIEYLMENCGDVCTVEDIYRRVWQDTPYCVRKTVVEHIRRIRSKIEPDPHNPCYIKVVFGIGYKMEKAG